MSLIIGKIRNFFSDINSRASAIQYSNLDKLSISGIPVFTYGLIGITTVILASYTILDSSEVDDNDEEDNEDESMISKLPTVEGIKDSLTKLSPFNSSESEEENPEPEEEENKTDTTTIGGKKTGKSRKNKTHRNKSRKSRKNRTSKSK